MKYCPNYGCVAYGRVVYSQSTRCVFCRWDLKPPRMKSEMPDEAPREVSERNEIEPKVAEIHSRAESKRTANFLTRSA